MTAPHSDDFERRQNLALRWQTATPRERRAMMREDRKSPESTRSSYVFVGVFFMVAALVQMVRAVAQHQPAMVIGILLAASVLSGAMAELSRRGRTRLGFSLLVVGMTALAFAELL
ncbi:hypothetical protein AB0M05_19190 [Streptomyces violaceusniger]|uniref:hypothetical protein n=1 Tax=Streptomyces TaxID=1883 RepID=UPI0009989085|nr:MULTISPECIES: hypothetical protein [Streptomyces]AQW47053.1 hypothetical protein SHXM_00516 [Streptomyces hygroscopicus]ASQ92219.1 hypothetical protein CGL27_02755 [Streptomyces sp. 11-1-2]MBO3675693.1 hypothetical protein [Streptomyces sp. NEAU-YJ-81]